MAQPQAGEGVVRRVAREIRRRRAGLHAFRGAFWGTCVAALLLIFKASFGAVAVDVAAAFVAAGALTGALYGALRRGGPVDAARLAGRSFGPDDPGAPTLEGAHRPPRAPLADALVPPTLPPAEA